MGHRENSVYRFGEFMLEPHEQRLSEGEAVIHLRPKAFAVLNHLVENHSRLIDRQSFFETIWAGVRVNDDVLTRCISEIRQALGDSEREPRFVRTTPKRGYTFIHPVQDGSRSRLSTSDKRATTLSAESPRITAVRSGQRIGLAVLPFADMSPKRDQEYFCDGVAEEILIALARIDELRVIARTSAFGFKGRPVDVRVIGKILDVDVVLEGSVRQVDERLRITAQLVDAMDGSHIWGERYDRDVEDIFSIQEEIAATIARELRVQCGSNGSAFRRRDTSSVEAHRLYLEGRYFLNRRQAGDYERAIALFERAIDVDAAYALPHAAIADAYTASAAWGFIAPQAGFEWARHAAERALAIDQTLAEPHLVLGMVALFHARDRDEAQREFDLSAELVLRNSVSRAWYAAFLIDQGRNSEAVAQTRAALLLDPLSAMVHAVAGAVHLAANRPIEARRLFERALDLDPSLSIAEHFIGWCCIREGRLREAEAPLSRAAQAGIVSSLAMLGLVYARSGERERASEVLAELDRLANQRWVPSFDRALIHVGLGDDESSFALLDRALERGEPVGLFTYGSMLQGLLPRRWVSEAKSRVARRRASDQCRRSDAPQQ